MGTLMTPINLSCHKSNKNTGKKSLVVNFVNSGNYQITKGLQQCKECLFKKNWWVSIRREGSLADVEVPHRAVKCLNVEGILQHTHTAPWQRWKTYWFKAFKEISGQSLVGCWAKWHRLLWLHTTGNNRLKELAQESHWTNYNKTAVTENRWCVCGGGGLISKVYTLYDLRYAV